MLVCMFLLCDTSLREVLCTPGSIPISIDIVIFKLHLNILQGHSHHIFHFCSALHRRVTSVIQSCKE